MIKNIFGFIPNIYYALINLDFFNFFNLAFLTGNLIFFVFLNHIFLHRFFKKASIFLLLFFGWLSFYFSFCLMFIYIILYYLLLLYFKNFLLQILFYFVYFSIFLFLTGYIDYYFFMNFNFFFFVIFSYLYYLYYFNKDEAHNFIIKNVLNYFFKSLGFLVVLYIIFTLSNLSFEIKIKKFIITYFGYLIFRIFKTLVKKKLNNFLQNWNLTKEVIKIYNFIFFIFDFFLEPIFIIIIFLFWKINFLKMLNENFGYSFFDKLFFILILFLILRFLLLLVFWLVAVLIYKKSKTNHNTRLATLLNLLNILLQIIFFFIFFVCLCIVLDLNISPFFSSFWIFTAGISISVQTLIKDIAFGVVIMFEDTFRIGDEVMVANIEGKIEDITLRVVKIRDPEGSLITIPFNQIDIVKNKYRNYAYACFEFHFASNNDAEIIIKTLSEAGAILKKMPEFKKKFLDEDLLVFGPLSIDNQKIKFEAKIKTVVGPLKPLKSAFNKICFNLFKEKGIALSDTEYFEIKKL